MTRLFNYFALVVMGALISSCAEEVEDAQPSVGGTVTMKTTVSLSENASTRALTEAGVKHIESLAIIESLDNNQIKLKGVKLRKVNIYETSFLL